MTCPGEKGPGSITVRAGLVELTELLARFCRAIPLCWPRAIHPKLKAVTSRSMQVTPIKSTVPHSQSTNSMRPEYNSHQRTRSNGLRLREWRFAGILGDLYISRALAT